MGKNKEAIKEGEEEGEDEDEGTLKMNSPFRNRSPNLGVDTTKRSNTLVKAE